MLRIGTPESPTISRMIEIKDLVGDQTKFVRPLGELAPERGWEEAVRYQRRLVIREMGTKKGVYTVSIRHDGRNPGSRIYLGRDQLKQLRDELITLLQED